MEKKEVKKIFKLYGITLTELEKIYKEAGRDAESTWKGSCIEEDTGYGIGSLRAQIGFSNDYGLMYRVYWHYPCDTTEPAEWYHALQVDILGDDFTAVDAHDYLYEDNYYQRTGKISDVALRELAKEYPLCIKPFEDVAVEIAEALEYISYN